MAVALLCVGILTVVLLGVGILAGVTWASRLSSRMARLEAAQREVRLQVIRTRSSVEAAVAPRDTSSLVCVEPH